MPKTAKRVFERSGTPVRVKKTRQNKNVSRSSVIAGANAADVVAISVELANPDAAAIAVVVIISVVAGGDRAADNGGADKAARRCPSPRPLAWADWVVEAIVPVTARAARATAAILVLIDIRNSIIRIFADRYGPRDRIGRSVVRIRFDHGAVILSFHDNWPMSEMVSEAGVNLRTAVRQSVLTSNLSTSASNSQNARAP